LFKDQIRDKFNPEPGLLASRNLSFLTRAQSEIHDNLKMKKPSPDSQDKTTHAPSSPAQSNLKRKKEETDEPTPTKKKNMGICLNHVAEVLNVHTSGNNPKPITCKYQNCMRAHPDLEEVKRKKKDCLDILDSVKWSSPGKNPEGLRNALNSM